MLVGDIKRRLVIEHFTADCVGNIPRATFGRVIFARTFDVYIENLKLRRPLDFPRKLRVAIKWRDRAAVAAAACPWHHIWLAGIGDLLAVESGDFGRANFAALLADDRKRQPFDVFDRPGRALVDPSDLVRMFE